MELTYGCLICCTTANSFCYMKLLAVHRTRAVWFNRHYDGCVLQVACGARHSVAVTSEGIVMCWGWGLHGQCGNGTMVTPTLYARCHIFMYLIRANMNRLRICEWITIVARGICCPACRLKVCWRQPQSRPSSGSQPARQASTLLILALIRLIYALITLELCLLSNCCERQMLLNSLLTYNSSMNHYQNVAQAQYVRCLV